MIALKYIITDPIAFHTCYISIISMIEDLRANEHHIVLVVPEIQKESVAQMFSDKTPECKVSVITEDSADYDAYLTYPVSCLFCKGTQPTKPFDETNEEVLVCTKENVNDLNKLIQEMQTTCVIPKKIFYFKSDKHDEVAQVMYHVLNILLSTYDGIDAIMHSIHQQMNGKNEGAQEQSESTIIEDLSDFKPITEESIAQLEAESN